MRYYDLSVERIVLQVLLYDFQSIVKLSTRQLIDARFFSDLALRRIYRAIIKVYDNGDGTPSRELVKATLSRLRKKTRDKTLAVFERLSEPKKEHIDNIEKYTDELANLETGRRIQFMVKGVANYLDEGDVGSAMGEVMKMTSSPATSVPSEESDFLDIFDKHIQMDHLKKENPELFRRFPTDISGIDQRTGDEASIDSIMNGGVMRGTVTMLVGSTGIGKSFALNEINASGIRQKVNPVFVTNEMSLLDAEYRAMSRLAGIPYLRFEKGELTDNDYARITKLKIYHQKRNTMAKFISYMEVSTVGTLRAKLLEWKQDGFVAGEIILDYLNEMNSSDGGGFRDTKDWLSIGAVASELRALSLGWDTGIDLNSGQRIYGIPIVTASQGKTGAAGKLAIRSEDAAYSPIPGQIAACIGFLAQDEQMKEQNVIDFILTKCRFGRLGRIRMYPNLAIGRLHSKNRAKKVMMDRSYDLAEDDK